MIGHWSRSSPRPLRIVGENKSQSRCDGKQAFHSTPVEIAGEVIFRFRDFAIPFTTENFLLSFALPNFYLHATTAYDILRMKGVPLGKIDFLGQMRIKAEPARPCLTPSEQACAGGR